MIPTTFATVVSYLYSALDTADPVEVQNLGSALADYAKSHPRAYRYLRRIPDVARIFDAIEQAVEEAPAREAQLPNR